MPLLIEQLYDKYAPALYGMILYNVKSTDAATHILQQLFAQMRNDDLKQDPGIFKLMTLAKTYTCTHMDTYPENFAQDETDEYCRKLSNDYILRLVTFGRYSIAQLSTLLYMEEAAIRKKIQLAMLDFRNRQQSPRTMLAGSY